MSPQGRFTQLTETADGTRLHLQLAGDWRRPKSAKRYDIWRRSTDGFGQILPRPTASEAAAFYLIEDYYTHEPTPRARKTIPLDIWKVLLHLAWRGDRSVEADAVWWQRSLGTAQRRCLEVGCGDGANLVLLKEFGHTGCGIEPDPAARAIASGRAVEVHEGTAEDIPATLAGRRFDCVLLMHALEHTIDPVQAINSAFALLDDEGLLVIEVPNNACLGGATFGACWHWLDVPRHLNFFTPKSLTDLVSAAGFDLIETAFCGYNRQFSREWAATQTLISQRLGDARGAQTWRYVVLLARTLFAQPAAKYDSVRILARKPARAASVPHGRSTSPTTLGQPVRQTIGRGLSFV